MNPPPPASSLLTHRLVEIPIRRDDDPGIGRHRALSALTVAHGLNKTVVIAWARPRPHGPVHVFVGGVEAAAGNGETACAFPPGARARTQTDREVEAALSGLEWERCQLALDANGAESEPLNDRIEELFGLNTQPMGFLVVATPLPTTDLAVALDALSDEVARLETLREGRGVHRRQLERAEGNLAYFDRVAGLGCWRLSVWTGGSGPSKGHVMAALLAGSADIAESALVIRPAGTEVSGQLAWSQSVVVGPDAVAAIARPPFAELPGIRVSRRPRFDQNLEDAVDVRLGSVLDETHTPAAPFGLSLDSINRHVFVCGATGAGKSETVLTLLVALAERGVPWLVVEPAKAEYAALAPWLDPQRQLTVIRPGDPSVPPPMLNPLEPSSLTVNGARHVFPLQTHLDLVRALFTASFDAQEPFPQVLGAGLTRAYQSRGWNLVTGQPKDPTLAPPQWPVLGDLVRESLAIVDSLGYGSEVRQNVRGFIRVRVESLRTGTPGRFFEGGFPLDLDDVLRRSTVFEIEDLGDDRDKAFFIGNMIIRIVELLRLRQKHGVQRHGLSHVLVIEEAHRLLRRVAEESSSAYAVTMFANLLAEIRAYGEGVVVAEQIPSKVIPDLVKNSAVKLMHRLPAEDDRITVGRTMNLDDEQSTHVVALKPGVAAAHTAGMDRPVLVQVERVRARRQTGAGRAAPPLTARSPACPSECLSARCTLGELEASRDLVTPAVSLWVEQFVMAHLTWDVVGTPTGTWFERLRAVSSRQAECALGIAVEASCARRGELIRAWHDPDEFVRDLSGRIAAQLATGRGLGRPPLRWAVGQFRYPAIRRSLSETGGGLDRSHPHPQTGRWRTGGIDLPGPSWEAQLAQLALAMRTLPQVRPWQIAGSPPVLGDLADNLGYRAGSDAVRLARAVASLGLEPAWVPRRTGAAT